MAPMASSRTPQRSLRPSSWAVKSPPPFTSVRLLSDRSAAPPNSSGSAMARAWIVACEALRVPIAPSGRQRRRPVLGQPPGHAPLELGGLGGVLRLVGGEALAPVVQQRRAARQGRPEMRQRLVGDEELAIGVPAVGLLRSGA